MSSNPPIPLRTGSRVYESTQRSFGTGSSASKSEIEAYDTFIREHRERDTTSQRELFNSPGYLHPFYVSEKTLSQVAMMIIM